MSYLNEHQVASILQTPHFSSSYTETITNYSLYRGRTNTSVLTLRFNLNELDEFELPTVHNVLQQRLVAHFPSGTQVLTSIDYDLLLKDAVSSAPGYYIWKANSNRHQFDQTRESVLSLTAPQIYQFAQNLYVRDLDALSIHFASSNVVVTRVLAVVCSFMPIKMMHS